MSASSFQDRWPENVPGKFYVEQQCLDCNLCVDTAPGHFTRNDAGGYFYVSRQPTTKEEETLLQLTIESCPCEAIFGDGDQFDWSKGTKLQDTPEARQKKIDEKACSHCGSNSKKWWQFWK
jgi:ferredoxin